MRLGHVFCAALLLSLWLVAGCDVLLGLNGDYREVDGGKGASGGGGSQSTGAQGGGGHAGAGTCNAGGDCDDNNPCTNDSCGVDNKCLFAPIDGEAAPAAEQTAGDCLVVFCTNGVKSDKPDDDDLPDDQNGCTVDSCSGGAPSHVPVMPAGQACVDGQGNGGSCDALGNCVVDCVTATDCQATNPCMTPSCDTALGKCVFTAVADGTPTPGVTQVMGDCHQRFCVGGMDTNVVDDTDALTTATDCDTELCDNGTPSNPPRPAGSPCSTYMGSNPGFCDDMGMCRECADDGDCMGPTDDCKHPACINFACGETHMPAMTLTTASPPQVAGDCASIVCDGNGGTMVVFDANDPQSDAKECTTDVCATVNMTNHNNVANGTACGAGGMLACLNGVCNGCMTSSQCPQASCTGTVLTKAQTCNAASCVAPSPATQDCAPYLCTTAGGGACTTTCNVDTDCSQGGAGNYCTGPGGSCVAKLPTSVACSTGNQCQSGFCVDGVCCNSQCSGLCQACSAAKKGGGANGQCGAVANGIDPDSECTDQGAASCGNDGFCNGAGACRKYAAGTVCVNASCSAGTLTKAKTCDGNGTCLTPSPATQNCSPYLCVSNACTSTCANDSQCSNGNWCSGGMCIAKLVTGAACTGTNQCQSNFCVDGYCCNSVCNTPCQACSAAKKQSGTSNGTCGAAIAGLSDPRNLCGVSPPCGNTGLCASGGVCQKTASGTQCAPQSCSGSTLTAATTCNGMGSCNTGGGTSLCPNNLVCNAAMTACLNGCVADLDCVASSYCDGVGACQSKATAGFPCSANNHCVSGICGITGNGACCSQACNVTDPVCGATGCDGTGACVYPNASTACGAPSCSGNLLTVNNCNGSGNCSMGSPALCPANLVCQDATSCFADCGTPDPAGDARCVSGYYCEAPACQPKLNSGLPCTRDGQCLSNWCQGGGWCN